MENKVTIYFVIFILTLTMLSFYGCKKDSPEVISLDASEIKNKTIHTGTMIVNFSAYLDTGWEVFLNQQKIDSNDPVTLSSGFFTIQVYDPISGKDIKWIRFVILDPDRAEAEWGLPAWTPKARVSTGEAQDLSVIYSRKSLEGIDMPIILNAKNSVIAAPVFGECNIPDMNRKAKMKHGWASFPTSGALPK